MPLLIKTDTATQLAVPLNSVKVDVPLPAIADTATQLAVPLNNVKVDVPLPAIAEPVWSEAIPLWVAAAFAPNIEDVTGFADPKRKSANITDVPLPAVVETPWSLVMALWLTKPVIAERLLPA
jgi:hypothetical protein